MTGGRTGAPVITAGVTTGVPEGRSAPPVDVDDVDTHRLAVGKGLDDGAQRARRPTRPADDAAEVVGVHAHFEQRAPAQRLAADLDVIRVGDDAADEVLQCVDEHRQPSACAVSSACSTWADVSLPPGAPSSAASAGCSLAAGWSAGGCSLAAGATEAAADWSAGSCSLATGAAGAVAGSASAAAGSALAAATSASAAAGSALAAATSASAAAGSALA